MQKKSAPEVNIKESTYHHGDLQNSLLTTATVMITEQGIESLSLRKLAERINRFDPMTPQVIR